ncbi:MAG: hypothetical protein K4445_04610 [Deltaproteobacteria bacterium]|jgi:monofunctional biosynthetic peptidoglycan transglycosylase
MFGIANDAGLEPRKAAQLAAALPDPRRFHPDAHSRYAANRAERIYPIMVRRGIVIEEYDDVTEENKNESTEEPAPVLAPSEASPVPESSGTDTGVKESNA